MENKFGNPIGGFIAGMASAGTATSLTDQCKNFIADSLIGRTVMFDINNIEYIREITDNDATSMTFAAIDTAVAASAKINDGDNSEITVILVAAGANGNNVTATVVAAPGTDDALSASYSNGVLTVYLGKTAGELDDTENTATLVAAAIDAISEVTASVTGSGGVVTVESDITFSGGEDALIVPVGTEYQLDADIQGVDATGINQPTGGIGIKGWLSGIYNLILNGLAKIKLFGSGLLNVTQVGVDQEAAFANDAIANTQINVDFTKPTNPSLLHKLIIENPFTASDLRCKLFAVELTLDGATRYAYIDTLVVPKNQPIYGTTISTYSYELEGLFAGTDLRIVVSNDTALGASDGDSAYFRIKSM